VQCDSFGIEHLKVAVCGQNMLWNDYETLMSYIVTELYIIFLDTHITPVKCEDPISDIYVQSS
jgi:hypothetical protein